MGNYFFCNEFWTKKTKKFFDFFGCMKKGPMQPFYPKFEEFIRSDWKKNISLDGRIENGKENPFLGFNDGVFKYA